MRLGVSCVPMPEKRQNMPKQKNGFWLFQRHKTTPLEHVAGPVRSGEPPKGNTNQEGEKKVKSTDQIQALAVKFVKFCGVGVVATLGHYIVGFCLFKFAAVDAAWSAGIGATVGAIISYFMNRSLTFQSSRAHRETVWRFAVVAVGAAVFTWIIMKLLADFFMGLLGSDLGFMVAQVLTTVLVLLWTFPVNLIWTFAENRNKEKMDP